MTINFRKDEICSDGRIDVHARSISISNATEQIFTKNERRVALHIFGVPTVQDGTLFIGPIASPYAVYPQQKITVLVAIRITELLADDHPELVKQEVWVRTAGDWSCNSCEVLCPCAQP
jgi:hypothetical protein